LGQERELPGGLGSVSFDALPRYISVDIHRDPTQIPVALFSLLVVGGLVTSLFVVRRRVWVKSVISDGKATHIELAALSRNDDPGQDAAIDHIAQGILLGQENRVKA